MAVMEGLMALCFVMVWRERRLAKVNSGLRRCANGLMILRTSKEIDAHVSSLVSFHHPNSWIHT